MVEIDGAYIELYVQGDDGVWRRVDGDDDDDETDE